MKFLIAAVIALASLTAKAEMVENSNLGYVPPGGIWATNHLDRSVWFTVYNAIGQISDVGCAKPGQKLIFSIYAPPFSYGVRGEVKENKDCSGRTFDDIEGMGRATSWYGIDATMYSTPDRVYLEIHDGYNP